MAGEAVLALQRAKRVATKVMGLDYFLPRVMCLDGPNVWPLTPFAICWISPPDFRKASICSLIESLVSTAGAGLALVVDAFTRMMAINLYTINLASHDT